VKPSVRVERVLRTYGIVVALVLLVLVISISHPSFLAYNNQMNILSQWTPVGLMSVGMTYVILTAGFDLSVGAVYTISAVVAAALGRTHSLALSFSTALLVALLLGLVNGLLVAYVKVNPFIATLGTSFAIGGITLVVTNNRAFVVSSASFSTLGSSRIGGVPYSGLLLLAALVLGGLGLARTIYGQKIYAVGGNPEASRLAGLNPGSVVTRAYCISGLCSGLAGIVTASQLSSAQAGLAGNVVFDVITVVVVGGTSLAGGFGAMWRTAVGLAILATLQNGFNLLNVDPHFQDIVKGIIIVGALALDSLSRRLGARGGGSAQVGPGRLEAATPAESDDAPAGRASV